MERKPLEDPQDERNNNEIHPQSSQKEKNP
jgi:hypothetical protein